jgi:hypothetical protein
VREPSRLEAALARGLAPGGDLIQELALLRDYALRTGRDAQALCLALARLIELPPETPDLPVPSRTSLDWLVGLFQQVETSEAFDVLRAFGLPPLLQLFDERSDRLDLLFLLKLFALYQDERGAQRIINAAREGFQAEGRLWSVIFKQLNTQHSYARPILDALRNPLPAGFLGVAYLDWVNTFCLAEEIARHPFDTEEGMARLHGYLTDPNPQHHSFAQSAAAALPFLTRTRRGELLALALDHPCQDVQMEGAWASAKLGSAAGVNFLARMCLDPVRSKQASRYLRELGLEEAIPRSAQDPTFIAQAELVAWLAHPQEFGEPPDEISLYDTRELYWPPTKDRRRFWLFRYRYDVPPAEHAEATGHSGRDTGVGLVGSLTFSLVGETTPDMSPEDIYALHCCWELEYLGDSHAPAERTVAAGRQLLDLHHALLGSTAPSVRKDA